jgi:hypothetical protein
MSVPRNLLSMPGRRSFRGAVAVAITVAAACAGGSSGIRRARSAMVAGESAAPAAVEMR